MDRETALRNHHRERMASYGSWCPEPQPGDSYEEAVVWRATEALDGREDRPWRHSHAADEVGACRECDAAALVEWWEDLQATQIGAVFLAERRRGTLAVTGSRGCREPNALNIREGDMITIGGQKRRVADVKPDSAGGVLVDLDPL
jgi:hypothetical protein